MRIKITFHAVALRDGAEGVVTEVAFVIVLTKRAVREADSFPYKRQRNRIHDLVSTSAPKSSGR